nr:lysosomal acid lipase/cholesteryl ester hydrolase-like [Leptinotarsa decemlineata]
MRSISELLASVVFVFSSVISQENNVCPTFKDYYTIKNNSRCWYDLAAEYSAPEIIQRMGYPLLTYKVQTADGYILTMFRIPNDHINNPDARFTPIYLQHGLVATSASFLGKGRDSLAFVLSDAGYDVWLGNYRGNPYSEEHVNMTIFDQEYWNHGLDEVALLDIPAQYQTILDNTAPGSKIIFIGHSLGTTVSLMFASEYPERARKIMKMMVLLCPAYTLTNMVSPYKMLAPMGDFVLDTVRRLKLDRIVSHARELRRFVIPVCMESPELMRNCMQMYNLFYGPNTDLGPESIPVYFNQAPGGTSIKILNHAADFIKGNFRKYNYNELNYKVYGTPYSPKYDISKVHVPVYLVYSAQDWATTEAV